MSDGQVVIDVMANDKQFGKVISGLGKSAAIGLAAVATAVIGIGAAGLIASTQFNEGMANVASLIPGNVKRVGELKDAVQDMSIEFGASTRDLTSGLYQSISAFGDTADTVKLLEINTKAAAAGVATVTDSINLTSAVTKAYGDTSAKSVQQAADLALMTVRLGQTTFPELAASIGRVTPMSKNLKISQEELFATFATLTGVTGKASEVSTQMAAAQRALANPTDDATTAFKKSGYATAQAAIDHLGYVGALGLLTDEAKKTHKPLADFIQDQEGQTFALAITGAQAGEYTKKLGEMKTAAGTTDEAFKEQTDGVNALGFAWKQLKSLGVVALQELGDAIGNAFGPTLSDGVTSLETAVDGMVGMLSGDKGGAAKFQKGIGDFVKNLSDMLVIALPTLIEGFVALLTGMTGALPGIIATLLPVMIEGFKTIVEALPLILPALIDAFVQIIMVLARSMPEILPLLADAFMLLVVTLTEQLGLMAPELIPVLLLAVQKMGFALAAQVPVFLKAALVLIGGLAIGLATGLSGLISRAPAMWAKLLKPLTDKLPQWRAAGSSLIAGMLAGLSSKFSEAAAWASKIGGRLRNSLGNLSSLLTGNGRAIIQGLWDGMKSLWERCKSWVSGIADWIKQHKGPVSADAKLLRPAGLAIMEGLLGGLKDGWKPVASLLDGYTTSLSGDIGVAMGALAVAPSGFTPSAATYGGPGRLSGGGSSRNLSLAAGAIQIVLPPGTSAQTQQAAADGVLAALAREWKRS